MDHIGMDAGMMSSHICELTEAGDVVERQIQTERRRLHEVFGSRPKARILIEASNGERMDCVLPRRGRPRRHCRRPELRADVRAAEPTHRNGSSGRTRAGGNLSARCVSAGAPDVTDSTRRARGRGDSRATRPNADTMDCPYPDSAAAGRTPPRTRARGAVCGARERRPVVSATCRSDRAGARAPRPAERADRRVGQPGEQWRARR
jgi:hypothetical protein